MSKRARELKRGRETKRGYASLNNAIQTPGNEVPKISSTFGVAKKKSPTPARWKGDTDEDLPPRPQTRIDPLAESDVLRSGLDDDGDDTLFSELQLSDAASRAGSSATGPDGKRIKLRDGPTPEFSVNFDELSPSLSDHLSFFKWARDEIPPSTSSPPKDKVNDEIDPGDAAGAIPVEKPKVGGNTAAGPNIFRPIPKTRIEKDYSSDSSDMFIEQDTDTDTEMVANRGDAPSVDPSLAKSHSFDPALSKSQSFDPTLTKARSLQPSLESDEEQAVKEDDPPIVIPIATLVEDPKPEASVLEEEGKKPFYERRKFWVFVLCQVVIVAIVVVLVLILRKNDSDNEDAQRSSAGLDGTATPAPSVLQHGLTSAPSPSPNDTPLPTTGTDFSPTALTTSKPTDSSPTVLSTPEPTPFPTFWPTNIPSPFSLKPEFPEIPSAFLNSYDLTLLWFDVDFWGIGDPNLQRFVLGWFWFATTRDGEDPWIMCNPPSDGESQQCEFLADNIRTDSADLCYTSKTPTNSWLSSANECSWAGISCDSNGRVTAIKLPGVGLKGNFPFFIDRLTELVELDLSFGGLDGTIPEGIGGIVKLQKLDLSHNFFASPIPDPLFLLPLTSLKLNANRFQGQMSPGLGSLSAITVLDLSENEFSGTLPVELGIVISLEELALGDNSLTGANLPSSWGNLENMRELKVQRSGLGGVIPAEFAGLAKLEKLDLQSNNLVGSLPPMPWQFLLSLDVQGNRLEGNFPQEFYDHPLVRVLNLARNRLSVTIEDRFNAASTLEYLNLESNDFSGPIPPSFANLSGLSSLRLQNNFFSGAVPDEICSLRELSLVELVADCVVYRFSTQNPCRCCTACCGVNQDVCRDSNLLPESVDTYVCAESFRWDPNIGVIESLQAEFV